jgi:tripartite-type tricarboxylate transporter receptor subunit TctC
MGDRVRLVRGLSHCINPTLYSNAGYDPRKDFAPIGLIGSQPSVLTVHPSLPARTPSELVTYAKANPGKVNYAFVPGTIGQMTAEMFARSAGIELTRCRIFRRANRGRCVSYFTLRWLSACYATGCARRMPSSDWP